MAKAKAVPKKGAARKSISIEAKVEAWMQKFNVQSPGKEAWVEFAKLVK